LSLNPAAIIITFHYSHKSSDMCVCVYRWFQLSALKSEMKITKMYFFPDDRKKVKLINHKKITRDCDYDVVKRFSFYSL
jgi:hypothetical protein